MTNPELEILLAEKCDDLGIKKMAFDAVEKIFQENAGEENFLCGFERCEITLVFERFEYHIRRQNGHSIIVTRIGLHAKRQDDPDDMEFIGYYELETNWNGEVLDDWFVIEKEKTKSVR